MPELLLEILTEEVPARMQVRAAKDLKRLVLDGLKEAGLEHGKAHAHVTPRRLVLAVEDIPEKQPDVKEERKGPKVGAPEQALKGFLGSVGVASVDACEQREIKGNMFYFVAMEKEGQETAQVLPGIIAGAMGKLPWPKSMRWGDGDTRWVRPLHSILCLFGGHAVAVEFASVMAGTSTVGHRFHAPQSITVKDFADYKSKLVHVKVMLDHDERRRVIAEQAERLAAGEKLTLKPDQGLLAEVAGLVEWPVVLMGTIDAEFMDLPPEVLSTAMRSHQKYFSTLNSDGTLAARFIVVSNMEAADGGKAIVAGNERVLRARLSDAKFFWGQDRKNKLVDRLEALGGRVFYKGLGTMLDKAERIATLARKISAYSTADAGQAERAAKLAKADLSSDMVGEFAELQGIIGGYYARADGEGDEVAQAIAEHYAPQGPGDACPTQPLAVVVSLADKIDTLVGFFGINEKPTGSKDPFALRRAALGVIRLIIENGLEIPLINVFKAAQEIYGDQVINVSLDVLAADLMAFFADRLKAYLKEKGVRHDLISAVFEVESGEDDLNRLLARVDALKGFLETEDGGHLLVAYRRAANILRIEEKRDGQSYTGVADEGLLEQDDERALFDCLAKASDASQAALRDERFVDAMLELARLRGPVDNFFDNVTVNCEDSAMRGNRLRLLSQIRSALGGMADFSKIEGSEK